MTEEESERECGFVWGYHREHYCTVVGPHDFPMHFCECDEELDMKYEEPQDDSRVDAADGHDGGGAEGLPVPEVPC